MSRICVWCLEGNQLVHALVGNTQQFADVPHRDMSVGQVAGQLFGFVLRPAGQLVSACVLLADRLGPASDVLDLTYPLDAHAHAHLGHRDVECHGDEFAGRLRDLRQAPCLGDLVNLRHPNHPPAPLAGYRDGVGVHPGLLPCSHDSSALLIRRRTPAEIVLCPSGTVTWCSSPWHTPTEWLPCVRLRRQPALVDVLSTLPAAVPGAPR